MKSKLNFSNNCIFILLLILTLQIIPTSGKYLKNVVNLYTSKDWGLGYNTSIPTGTDSSDLLLQYNSFYLDPNLSKDEKVLYLTFDCGYENGYTSSVLDTLKEKNVPATFFVVSHYIKTAPELLKRMINEGHIVGNHSMSHSKFSTLSTEKIESEILELEKLYKETTGKEMKHYFRPPSGNYTIDALDKIKSLGYKSIFWSVAYADWDNNKQMDGNEAMKKIKSRIHNGAIILLHATSKTNSEILGTLIDDLKHEGYEFKSLDYLTSKSLYK